ncbi:MAG TPA: hypothetical protein VFP78_14085 [Solirubrobacteraceae bacterium]|nr:hypothetical protein [Solirubrobacteraceae bacterium]
MDSLVDDPCVASVEEQAEALGAGKDADVAVSEIEADELGVVGRIEANG